MTPKIAWRDDTGGVVEQALRHADSSDLLDCQPFRRPSHYRGQRNRPGEYWATTMGAHVIYESRHELLRLQIADRSADVTAIAAQPFCLAYIDRNGKDRRHIPDYMLRHRNGEVVIVNVKPPDWLRRARAPHDPDFPAISHVFAARGWRHELWTGVTAVLAANIRLLAGYRRPWTIDQPISDAAVAACNAGDTIGSLERRLAADHAPRLVRPAVLHAIWMQRLMTDLSTPLEPHSVLRRPGMSGG
ncbi:MAG TPA: TnsA-like heteromeric transposase endonuclease subunit [Mycobacteriales bacterium]|nr:TnsA-like heteromeric transposase endonuclease subunit [Mycobacteriales bacterium]